MVNISDSEAKAGFRKLKCGKRVQICKECGHLVSRATKYGGYVHLRAGRRVKCENDPWDLRVATPGKEWASGTH